MTLEIAIIALLALVLVTNFIIIFRKGKGGGSDTEAQFKKQNELNERLSKMQIDNIKAYNETVLNTIAQQNYLQKQEFSHIQTRLENILRTNDERLNRATDVLSQGLTKGQ